MVRAPPIYDLNPFFIGCTLICDASTDYVNHLRDHIGSGTRPQFSATYEESQHKYLNAALHFKALYEESVKHEETLKNKLLAVEQAADLEAEELRAQLIAQAHPVAGKKRKPDELLQPLVTKRIVRDEDVDTLNTELDLAVAFESSERNSMGRLTVNKPPSMLTIPITGDVLLRQIYYLRKELKMHDIDDLHLTDLLEQTLRKAVTVVWSLRHALAPATRGTLYDRPEPSVVCLAFRKSILPLIFAAMNKVDDGSYVTSSSSGNVIYEGLVLFKAMVDYTSASAKMAGVPQSSQDSSQESTPTSWSAKIVSNAEAVVKVMCNYVHHCHGSSAKSLPMETPRSGRHNSRPTHAALLEGLMHLLLTRAGQLMYTLTFTAPFTSDLDEQMAGSMQTDDQAVNAARLEAKLLTPILRRLLPGSVHVDFLLDDRVSGDGISAATPNKPNSAAKRGNSQTFPATPSSRQTQQARVRARGLQTPSTSASPATLAQKYSLVSQPLNKIQNSLLKGIFGEDDNGGLIGHTLRSPLKPRYEAAANEESDEELGLDAGISTDEGDGGEPFITEMWCRVGWDVLAKGLETTG